ncbi:hypothetical protein [Propionibacterium sp. oral taxon 192]|nr:hypothetical protein [Propionibacterium sp. oral taxon 192]
MSPHSSDAFAHEFQALDSLRVAEALDRRLQAAGRGRRRHSPLLVHPA